jgi:hypothetical protein
MEIAFMKDDEGKREELVIGDWAGEVQESVRDVGDGTCYLKGGTGDWNRQKKFER